MWIVKVLVGITLGCIYSEGNTVIYIEGPINILECDTVSSSSSLSNVGTDNPLLDVRCPGASKRVGKQCLFFNMEEKLTWYAAKDACAAKGQELAALQNLQGVIDYINNMDNIGRGDYFWTGGSDASTEGILGNYDIFSLAFGAFRGKVNLRDTWVWLDGSSVGAIPWYRNNGDSGTGYNCLQVDYEGYYDVSCTDEVYYICADGV